MTVSSGSFLSIQPLGRNGEQRRLWIESQRLDRLGFPHGMPFHVEPGPESLTLRPAVLAANHVSSRSVAGGRRPIIDLADQSLLSALSSHQELRVIASFERIVVTPSHRAFAIQRSRTLHPPLRVLDVFGGGGTLSSALTPHPVFQIVGGVEVNPDFGDEWQRKHPDSALLQADVRGLHDNDYPEFDVLIGGIPCTSHSNLGRAKKALAGQPELGDTGDLFIPVMGLIAARMPAGILLENVPAFGTSLAGRLISAHLSKLGYHVFTTVLNPNADWREIEDRRRWLMVATLDRPFQLTPPGIACRTPVSAFLDPPDQVADAADAARIATTIKGLRRHNTRHQAAGHGFEFTVIEGAETRIPTIPRSYHKINTGPFVATPYGPRLLRQGEIERIHGCGLSTDHYATAVQILGQGVLVRVFESILGSLGAHLLGRSPLTSGVDSAKLARVQAQNP